MRDNLIIVGVFTSLLGGLYSLMPSAAGIDILCIFGGLLLTIIGLYTSKDKAKQILVTHPVGHTDSTQVKKIQCQKCNSLIPEDAKYCTECGYSMSEVKNPKIRLRHLGYLGLVVIYSLLLGTVAQNAKIGILSSIFTLLSMGACILIIIFILFFHALE